MFFKPMSDITYIDGDGEDASKRLAQSLSSTRPDGKVLVADDFESELFALRMLAGRRPRAPRAVSWSLKPLSSGNAASVAPVGEIGLGAKICIAVLFIVPAVCFVWMCRRFGWL